MIDYDIRVQPLIEFGKEIERYFLELFHSQSGISFLFYINDALFQSFSKKIGRTPLHIKAALRYCIFLNKDGTWQNPHVAFSMAALQTAVALELSCIITFIIIIRRICGDKYMIISPNCMAST